jgi:hypothetical protein
MIPAAWPVAPVFSQALFERTVVLGLGETMGELLAVQPEQHGLGNETINGREVALDTAAADKTLNVVARSAGDGRDRCRQETR